SPNARAAGVNGAALHEKIAFLRWLHKAGLFPVPGSQEELDLIEAPINRRSEALLRCLIECGVVLPFEMRLIEAAAEEDMDDFLWALEKQDGGLLSRFTPQELINVINLAAKKNS